MKFFITLIVPRFVTFFICQIDMSKFILLKTFSMESVSTFSPDAGTTVIVNSTTNIAEVTGEAACGGNEVVQTGNVHLLPNSVLVVGGN